MENSARETVYHNSGMRQLLNLVPILSEKHKSSFLAWARRPSSRGCYPLDVDVQKNTMVGVTVSLWGMVFGALHWLAWDSAFPTQVQQTLWHVSSCYNFCPGGICCFLFHRSIPSQIQSRNILQCSSWPQNQAGFISLSSYIRSGPPHHTGAYVLELAITSCWRL
jgi:hypothetical protein